MCAWWGEDTVRQWWYRDLCYFSEAIAGGVIEGHFGLHPY